MVARDEARTLHVGRYSIGKADCRVFMSENDAAAERNAFAEVRFGECLIAFIAMQEEMRTDDGAPIDFENNARRGQRIGELTIVIAADQSQSRSLSDIEREPPQLGVQGRDIHGAMHDVTQQHYLFGAVFCNELQQAFGGVFTGVEGQKLPIRAMCPGIAEMQIGYGQGAPFLQPHGASGVEPHARFEFKTGAVHFLFHSTIGDRAAPSSHRGLRRAAPL